MNLFGKFYINLQNNHEFKLEDGIKIKMMIKHPMHTGNQYNNKGKLINKNIIQKIIFQLNSIEIFSASLGTGISKDPFFELRIFPLESSALKIMCKDEFNNYSEKKIQLIKT